jgi:hypothetical protein
MLPPGYEIRASGTIIGKYGRPMKGAVGTNGYISVTLWLPDGTKCNRLVHALVCERFHGPCPFPGAQVRHLDGNPLNNRAENLCWGTAAENAADRKRHGTEVNNRGARCGTSKLTEQQVREIRARYAAGGVFQRDLAREYEVSNMTVSDLLKRRTWGHC